MMNQYTKFFHILFCYIFDLGLKKTIMRHFFLLFIFAGFLASCSQSSGTDHVNNSPEANIKNQAIALAESYAKDQQKKVVINPDLVFTGLIDEDEHQDAIVSASTIQGPFSDLQLILIQKDGKLMLSRAIEADMNILSLKNRVITAEVPTRPRSSPLYDCLSCKELADYQLSGGELVRIK